MQDHELDAYLGDVTATDDQRKALHAAADRIDAEVPADDREAAFAVAVEVILGDSTLDDLGGELRVARQAEARALERVFAGIAQAAADGMPETEIARRAGVDRMTVRKVLGKR